LTFPARVVGVSEVDATTYPTLLAPGPYGNGGDNWVDEAATEVVVVRDSKGSGGRMIAVIPVAGLAFVGWFTTS
jgi:hypothetical protein